jgi:hypothetical protein
MTSARDRVVKGGAELARDGLKYRRIYADQQADRQAGGAAHDD